MYHREHDGTENSSCAASLAQVMLGCTMLCNPPKSKAGKISLVYLGSWSWNNLQTILKFTLIPLVNFKIIEIDASQTLHLL